MPKKNPASVKKTLRYLIVLSLLVSSGRASAASWDFTYRNLSQVRKDRTASLNVPINQYAGFGLSELPLDTSFQTSMRIFADPALPDRQFDLYQADIHIEPVKNFDIDGGRQWNVDGFEGGLLDGLKMGLFPEGSKVGGSIFAGVPRYVEDGNFHNVIEGLEVGLNLNLMDVKDTALQFSTRWRKIDATKNSWNKNDTIYVGLVGRHQFSGAWSTPNVYGNVEFDIAGKTLDVATLGLDLYPHWRVALTIEGNRFNVNRGSNQQTIFGNYFSGSIAQGREALQVKIMKSLHFVQDFSYQHYRAVGLGGENGYTAGAGLDHYWKAAKLSSLAEYYYRKSFGGKVNGAYAQFSNNYFKKWLFDVSVDVSRYSKITGQRNTAVSVVGDLGYLFNDRCKLSLGGEFNHNNWFDRDGRVTVNLELGFDKSNYHPEERSKRANRRFHEI